MDKRELRKTLIRYGYIVQDESWDNDQGSFRETLVTCQGETYRIRMHNGEVITIATI